MVWGREMEGWMLMVVEGGLDRCARKEERRREREREKKNVLHSTRACTVQSSLAITDCFMV